MPSAAAQHRLPIVFVVMRNGEYSILKSFAVLEKTPGVPGLDLPGVDIASIAAGFGCRAVNVDSTEKLAHEFTAALRATDPPSSWCRPNRNLRTWDRCHD